MQPDFMDLKSRNAWRVWIKKCHASASEVWLAIQKKGSPANGLSLLDEAVQEALCCGWIDGKLRCHDDDRFLLRLSSRKRGSELSVSNVRWVESLSQQGRMTVAGLPKLRDGKESGQWRAAQPREREDEILGKL